MLESRAGEPGRLVVSSLLVFVCTLAWSPIEPCDSRPQALAAPYSRQPMATGSPFHFRSPIENARQLLALSASPSASSSSSSSLLWRQNGRLPGGQLELERYRTANLFQCDEPSRELYESFVRQYNRTFADSADKLERLNLFAVTLKRAIFFNKVVQHEILKRANYEDKPEVRNYHFVEATSGQNAAIWFADITDCELGLIKKTVFDIFYHLDANDYAEAYRVVQLNKDFLPALLSADGFEQLANILLVRLHDRFRGDQKMNQLFAWPLYFKKLAAFVYNQQQASQPGYKTKLALISFAYPAYFKDLKYNLPAINRTGDNVRANQEHELFFKRLGRQFASLAERNRRLAIFRQRWSLINQLNHDHSQGADASAWDEQLVAQRARHASQLPDWLRAQHKWDASDLPIEYNASHHQLEPLDPQARSGRLQAAPAAEREDSFSDQVASGARPKQFKLTQFGDLTDLEFVAFLSNDFSLLDQNRDSADYIERNFPLRPLDAKLRWELAHELELRRGLALATNEMREHDDTSGQRAPPAQWQPLARTGLRLAKQVVDELISDVGLPIGPATLEGIQEEEFFRIFDKLARHFEKPYAQTGEHTSQQQHQLSASDLADERQRRYLVFKQNYARFRAWMIKESWQLDETQMLTMLRLADMSWLEIKLGLFRICCLSSENLLALSSTNATIQYLASNYELLCQNQMSASRSSAGAAVNSDSSAPNSAAKAARQADEEELHALELYYYYSAHFNKHHSNQAEFARRADIFRRNIDAIRHHSCVRSLTLYESLRLKRPEWLSTMDVIDSRRSHTDDLNLDRFEYFKLPASLTEARPAATDLIAAPQSASSRPDDTEPSRAFVGYKRDYFSSLIRGQANRPPNSAGSTLVLYADKLLETLQDSDTYARRYHENRVGLVYDLVIARYKFCMKNYENIDLDASDLRQQCQANGPLGDGVNKPLNGYQFSSLDANDQSEFATGRLQAARPNQRDRCAYYRQGLEPWSAGLVRQDERSIELIRQATCSS